MLRVSRIAIWHHSGTPAEPGKNTEHLRNCQPKPNSARQTSAFQNFSRSLERPPHRPRARSQRRSLRHHLRHEFAEIRELEKRSREPGLYAAWSQPRPLNVVPLAGSRLERPGAGRETSPSKYLAKGATPGEIHTIAKLRQRIPKAPREHCSQAGINISDEPARESLPTY